MNKYTPSPWGKDSHMIQQLGRVLALRGDGHKAYSHAFENERQANVALIAAAPLLLEALERVLENSMDAKSAEEYGGYVLDTETRNRVEAAIANAKGEQSA